MKQRILIGTDILLAYLMNTDYYEGIAVMFRWMRLTGARKMIDHGTIAILTHFVKTDVLTRLRGFDVVEVVPRMSPFYYQLSRMQIGKGDGRALLMQLNMLEQGHVDLLITENQNGKLSMRRPRRSSSRRDGRSRRTRRPDAPARRGCSGNPRR